MYYSERMSQYVMAPYLLEDEHGEFTLANEMRWFVMRNFKTYVSGEWKGKRLEVDHDQATELRKEAEALYGTTDWKADFVPGILAPELPELPDVPDRNGG